MAVCSQGHENPEGLGFCRRCGVSLGNRCPAGHDNPPGQRHCGQCGAPLAAAGGEASVASSHPYGPPPRPAPQPASGSSTGRTLVIVGASVVGGLFLLALVSILAITFLGRSAEEADGPFADVPIDESAGPEWPAAYRETQIDTCVATSAPLFGGDQARTYCTCVIDRLEDSLTYAEAQELDRQVLMDGMADAEPPEELRHATRSCS
ncbi:MAG: hypothetical protein U5R31_05250 [Acidimicrobiia bacterium]|nr:hypothetical protein [Acidimicrobiia bacterium]